MIDLTLCRSYKVKTCLSTLFCQLFLPFLPSSFLRMKLEIHSMNHLQMGELFVKGYFTCTYHGEVRWVWNRSEFIWNYITFTKVLWCPRPGYFYMCYLSNVSHELDKHHQLWKQGNELTELVRDGTRIWT